MTHPFDDTRVFRIYEPHELKNDRYPYAWESLGDGHDALLDAADIVLPGKTIGVKDVVRQVTGHRCQRCRHPYWVGRGLGEWETLDPVGGGAPELRQIAMRLAELGEDTMRVDRPTRIHWSPCDELCTHDGPTRIGLPGGWHVVEGGDVRGWDVFTVRVQAAYRILTVHHLNERKFDLRWWNLAALCQRCHLTIQRKVTMEDPWPWEHSEWFRPHAAAWYALKYLGENLTYTQTMDRLDMLLDLGRREEATERMAL